MKREAILLAGGLGTRLSHLIPGLPKPMAPVGGKPFLSYLLDQLSKNHFSHIVLSTGYQAQIISDHFGHNFGSLTLTYSIEETPLGTGGAIKKALSLCRSDSIFILNGDTFFDVDFSKMEKIHSESQAVVTMAVKPLKHYSRYGTVVTDQQKIVGFLEKQAMTEGLINGGTYLVEKASLPISEWPDKFSFEQDFFEKEVSNYQFSAFVSDGYFIDIGVPKDYEKANSDFLNVFKK